MSAEKCSQKNAEVVQQQQTEGPSNTSTTQSRLEALIEQQNLLMLRQLELAEEKSRRSESISTCESDYKSPRQFLKALDPCVRGIFASWQKQFCRKVTVYITQCKLSTKYQEGTAQGELLKPFLDEAQKPWEWTDFYRSIAKPLGGTDSSSTSVPVGLSGSTEKPQESPASNEKQTIVYDIDAAFAELRHRHAWEVQGFVAAHCKACLDQIVEDLALPKQVHVLQEQLATWALDHSGFYHPQAKQHLQCQAKKFVELVFQEEMPKAESRIKAGNMPSSVSVNIVRTACMFAVLLAVMTMSHEVLLHIFAIIFALLCGMALLWEDLVLCSLRVLLGQTMKRVRQLGAVPELVRSQVDISIPSILWR